MWAKTQLERTMQVAGNKEATATPQGAIGKDAGGLEIWVAGRRGRLQRWPPKAPFASQKFRERNIFIKQGAPYGLAKKGS